MKRLVFAFLLFANTALSAQINDLLKDDNIVWIGEFSTDFVVEGYKLLDTSDYINTATLLKYLNTKPHYIWKEDKPLMNKIIDANRDSLMFFYHQNTFMNRINLIQGPDTIEVIDPVTQEKKIRIASSCGVLAPDPHYYRARQILFYDRKKKNFGLKVLAIGLIVDGRNESGYITGIEESGWLKPHNYTKKVDLNSPNILLAKRLATRNNSPCFDTDFKILKNTIGDIQETFMADMIQNTAIELYNQDDYTQKLSLLERAAVLNEAKKVYKLKIVQDWYWDEKLHTIAVRLVGVAPRVNMIDQYGQFMYDESIFYRMNE
jgi:hypothetical protein